MKLRLTVIEFVVADMATSLAFYRLLGLDLPDPATVAGEPHVQADLGGGLQIAFDTEETVRSFHPGWTRPEKAPRSPRSPFPPARRRRWTRPTQR